MARFTAAYSNLVQQLEEVETLRRLASEKERADPIGRATEINALCRSAVVLLSAHLEAYVKQLGEVALDSMYSKSASRVGCEPRFYYHLSKDLIDEIRDSADPDRVAERVFEFIARDASTWERTGSFPDPLPADLFNKGFANPAYSKIKKYFNRFGYGGYNHDLACALQADYYPVTNMIDHLVDTRNKIAHGDPTATKTPLEVREMSQVVQKYCRATDQLFADWYKGQFCPIR